MAQKGRDEIVSSDTPHYENEAPFEVPKSWEWTTIEDVTVNRDSERIPLSLAVRKKQQNKIYDYYGAAGVIDKVENYLFDERLLLVGEDGANLLSRSKDNAFFAEGKYWVNNHAHVLDCPSKSVLDYIAFVINSMSLEDYITGSAQPKLTQDNLNKILIPLPPEKEQHRIIESVNNYFSYISFLEGEIEEMDSFILKAKSKVLDLAIHGKLIPQDPNDEPAVELLNRINPKFTPCDNAHKRKDFLAGWCTSTIGDYVETVTDFVASGSFASLRENVTYYKTPNYAILVKTQDFQNGFTDDLTYTDQHGYEFLQKSNLYGGELILSNVGSIGKLFIVPKLNKRMTLAPNSIMVRFYEEAHIKWFYYLFSSKYGYNLLMSISSATAISKFNKTDFKKLSIPIPPLNEQKRIVAKIEELFAVLDEIQKSIEA